MAVNLAVRIEVIMKFYAKVFPIVFASIAFSSWAGEKVDQTISADGVNRVSIDNMRGKVKIIGWDQENVSVSGELDDETQKFIFQQNGSRIRIKVKVPSRTRNYNNNKDGSNLIIKMPSDIRMEFESVSSDVEVQKLTVGVEVETVSGDVIAKQLKEHVELGSVSGNIKASDISGNIKLSTVSGNIDSNSLSGKVSLSTVSGNIDDNDSSGRLQLKVVSGDVSSKTRATEISSKNISGNTKLKMAGVDELYTSVVSGDFDGRLSLNKNGLVKASGVSGDITFKFQDNVQANFRLSASAGGDIDNDITSHRATKAKYGPSSKLDFQTGDGNGSVKASTVSGEIYVK